MTAEPDFAAPLTLDRVAELVGGEARGTAGGDLCGVAPVDLAASDQLGFLAAKSYVEKAAGSQAGAFLVHEPLVAHLDDSVRGRAMVVVSDAHAALQRLLEHFHPPRLAEPGVHTTAVVDPTAVLGVDCSVGPHAVVEARVTLGDRSVVGAHTFIGQGATVGSDSILHPHAVLYDGVEVGDRVIVHSGVRLGVDGFGYVFDGQGHRKVPQVGRCVIEDDVEIGANACIDRGSIGETRIGAGTKIDNLVHVAHNVTVGPGSLIVAQVGIAGSSRVGTGVMLGGQVGVSGHLTIGDGARLGAQAGVIGDVPAGETYWGTPARPRRETLKRLAAMGRVDDLVRRVKALEAQLAALEGDPE